MLLPRRLQNQSSQVLSHLRHASALWYTEDGVSDLPSERRKEVWVVNGRQLPMVDWRTARASIRRRRTDVLVFGQTGVGVTHHYPESVVVGHTGEVVRFKRHYSDSPAFTDVCAEEASFLVASPEHASAVINHMVARGWGLDSVGAMTRRFYVRWSPTGCVLWTAASPGQAGSISGESLRIDSRPAEPSKEAPFEQPYQFPKSCGADFTIDFQTESRDDAAARAEVHVQVTEGDSSPAPNSGGTQTLTAPNADLPVVQADPSNETAFEVSRTSAATPNLATAAFEEPADADGYEDRRAYLFWKRALDITLTMISLIALSPLFVAVAILVKLTSRGPVFFAHTRQGLGGKEFPCLKFRSMRTGADAMQDKLRSQNEVDGPQFKIERDPRLTPLGKWLRQTNVDELPQLFNVLMGQMSLVGPRPSPDKENQLCPSWRRARLSVKPGVTGLWQVMRLRGTDQSDFQEWIYYDVEYARHRSLWLDWQIVLYTPVSILAPPWVKDLAKQLRKRGICTYSVWLE